MLQSKNGEAGTSEFYRCASYHGLPNPVYCEHGRETFPGWHRIYLHDFEVALQTADKLNGNDGLIALPYWDWTNNVDDGLPSVIRQRFSKWPDDLFPVDLRNQYATQTDELKRASDEQIANQIRAFQVEQQAKDCLLATQHWLHASTEYNGTYPSLESPHNSIHIIVGGQGGAMSSVAWAAYDIVFWLHHSNVDRIYEAYLKLEPDSQSEFENFQNNQREDLYDAPLEPFKSAESDELFYPKHTFSTQSLGYDYDILPPAPEGAQQLRQSPTLVVFPKVKISELDSKCYQIHVYVVSKQDAATFVLPRTLADIDYNNDNYAGGIPVFGRGVECPNCVKRRPADLVLDVSKTMNKLQLSRYDVVPKVVILETTQNENDTLLRLDETGLPQPIITGPLFESMHGHVVRKEDVIALQTYLRRFGYYENEIDGIYGQNTSQAVKDYQAATGELKVDGICGEKTKQMMVGQKRSVNMDGFAANDMKDEHSNFDALPYRNKKVIRYRIGVEPGYLRRDDVENAIAAACKQWSEASDGRIVFEMSERDDEEKEVDIEFRWKLFESEHNLLRYDGVGGVLGRGGNGFVEFDLAERWSIGMEQGIRTRTQQEWYRGQVVVSVYFTALHELGHALGLDHSMNAQDVMSPFYKQQQRALSANDKARFNTLWF